MEKVYILSAAIEYMERHLCEELTVEQVAAACYCSLSSLQKLYKYTLCLTLKEYIYKRRLTKAARQLLDEPTLTITQTAMEYGYSSPEAFSRAFTKLWSLSPSAYRKRWRFSGIFPKIIVPQEQGGLMSSRRNVDITELYDLFVQRRGCYFVCFDIKNLSFINKQIGHEAGDGAILEGARRIDAAAGAGDVLFRIGGDEFALLTDSAQVRYARGIADAVAAYNGSTYLCGGQAIPLTLHTGIVKYDEKRHLRYGELFTALQDTIQQSK